MSESQMEYQGLKYTVYSCDKCTTGEVFYTYNKLLEHTTNQHSKSIEVEFKASVSSKNGTHAK